MGIFGHMETPESILLGREEGENAKDFVEKALGELEGPEREDFLSYLSGCTDEEISTATGRAPASQKRRREFLVRKVRSILHID